MIDMEEIRDLYLALCSDSADLKIIDENFTILWQNIFNNTKIKKINQEQFKGFISNYDIHEIMSVPF